MSREPNIRSVIESIVQRLAAAYAPQKIILFGSHAYGQPDADSDIDLLIIKETSERFLDRMNTVREIAAGAYRGVPFEPIVMTPEEVQRRLQIGDQFISEILEKGVVLHGG